AIACRNAASNSSSAAMSASGTNRPPNRPKWPEASGSSPALANNAASVPVMRPSPDRPRRGRVAAGGHQLRHRLARTLLGHQTLPDEHGVRTGGGVPDEVVRTAYARLGHLHDRVRQARGDALEHAAVHLHGAQVAS